MIETLLISLLLSVILNIILIVVKKTSPDLHKSELTNIDELIKFGYIPVFGPLIGYTILIVAFYLWFFSK